MNNKALLIVIVLAVSTALAAQGNLQYKTPEGWVFMSPNSSMRTAEFVLPVTTGDTEDANMVIFYFGGGGGSIEANLERWMGQVKQPDGRPSRSVAKVDEFMANGLKMTVLDVTGTFVAPIVPGQPEANNKPNFRLIAAVIETPGGPYFVRLTGPARTVAKWKPSVNAFLHGVSYR
jgi:hypothetical protein